MINEYNLSDKYSKSNFEFDLYCVLKKRLPNLVSVDVHTFIHTKTQISFVYKDLIPDSNGYSRHTMHIDNDLNLIYNRPFGNADIIKEAINELK